MAIRLTAYPAQTQLTPVPFESLLKAGALQQEKIDKADAELGALSKELAKIRPIEQDVNLTKETLSQYQKRIDDIYTNSKGNTVAMLPQIKELAREFNTDVAYGKLSTIIQRRAEQDASFKTQDEANQEWLKSSGDKGMSPEDYRLARQVEFEQQESLIQDPTTGKWTTPSGKLYNGIGARYTPNINKQGMELAKLITPETVTQLDPNLQKTNVDGIYYNTETNREYSFAEVRSQLLSQALKADPIISNYYNWKNTINGNGEAVANTYNELASRNFITQDQNGNPIQFNPSYVQELTERSLYPGIYEVSDAIGRLTAVNKSKSSIQFIKENEGKKEDPGYLPPLNTPYEQYNGVQSTTETIKDLTTSRTKEKSRTPIAGQYGLGKGLEEIVFEDYKADLPSVYNSLNNLDKTRVDYIKQYGKLGLPEDVTTWSKQDWTKVQNTLNEYSKKKVSAVLYPYNDTKAKDDGEFYNRQMNNFAFYDPKGVIGKNSNNLYSGSDLRALGYTINYASGELSNSNIVPQQIPGQKAKYTFARPVIVNASSSDGSKLPDLYVGINRAQITPEYLLDVVQNGLAQADQLGLPTELFTGSDIIVSPISGGYSIKVPGSESINLKADNTEDLEKLVKITFFPKNPTPTSNIVQSILFNNLFKED